MITVPVTASESKILNALCWTIFYLVLASTPFVVKCLLEVHIIKAV